MNRNKKVKGWNPTLKGINASDWIAEDDIFYDRPKKNKKKKNYDEEE